MAKETDPSKSLEQVAELFGVNKSAMHFFLCTGPDCCKEAEGQASWKALKSKIKQLYPHLPDSRIYRTKVGCLRMCREGPIALCYPQGKWFRQVTADREDDLIEHLTSGDPSPHELEFTEHPLPAKEG